MKLALPTSVSAALFFVIVTGTMTTLAQSANPAPTPPMGWNSWDAYGLTITEQQFRQNVGVLGSRLKPFGWDYAVIDEGWFLENPEARPHPETLIFTIDPNGRYVPVSSGRFPSAVIATPTTSQHTTDATPPKYLAHIGDASFKPLADWVHAQAGLKFGIHIVRGIPRASVERNLPIANSTFHAADAADTSDACPWDPTNWGVKDNAAGQAWYDSLLTQYADWGIDLLKVDCIANNPYKLDEIRMIRRAIDKVTAKTGRPIVLSLSPGPTSLDHAAEVTSLAQMWRISNDIWDYWSNPKPFPRSVLSQFETTAAWARYTQPGNWPDADMLPIGELRPSPGDGEPRTSRLTRDEQQTLLTLWSIARSPLILGANLTLLDESTLKLLTNRDLIAIDQTATASRQTFHTTSITAWTADLPVAASAKDKSAAFPGDYTHALALFNTGDDPITIESGFEAYGLDPGPYRARDVFAARNLPTQTSVSLTLEPHASTLLLLRK